MYDIETKRLLNWTGRSCFYKAPKTGNHNITNSGRIACNFYNLHKIHFQVQKFGKTISLKWKCQPHSHPKVAFLKVHQTNADRHWTPRDDLDAFLVPPPAAPVAETTMLQIILQLNHSTKKIKKWIVSLDIGSLDSLDSLFTIKNWLWGNSISRNFYLYLWPNAQMGSYNDPLTLKIHQASWSEGPIAS